MTKVQFLSRRKLDAFEKKGAKPGVSKTVKSESIDDVYLQMSDDSPECRTFFLKYDDYSTKQPIDADFCGGLETRLTSKQQLLPRSMQQTSNIVIITLGHIHSFQIEYSCEQAINHHKIKLKQRFVAPKAVKCKQQSFGPQIEIPTNRRLLKRSLDDYFFVRNYSFLKTMVLSIGSITLIFFLHNNLALHKLNEIFLWSSFFF